MAKDREEWCSNSRRWVIWMSMDSSIPATCPYNIANSGCAGEGCGYHQMRPPTRAFKDRERLIREMFGTDERDGLDP